MGTDFVSEVDRKFFSNNMLSHEDWEASMGLEDLMSMDTNMSSENDFMNDLRPSDFQLSDSGTTDFFSNIGSTTHDDLLNEWSDSSDSGICGLSSPSSHSVIKHEPLSPSLSSHSDSCDSASHTPTDFTTYTYTISDLSGELDPSTTLTVNPVTVTPADPLTLANSVSHTIDFSDTDTDPALSSQSSALHTHCLTLSKGAINPSILPTAIVKSEISPVPIATQSPNVINISLPLSPTSVSQIDTILNGKVKIQPKIEPRSNPSSPKRARTSPSVELSSPKSLVLTQEEFDRLTHQGVLRFQPPKQESILPGPTTLPATHVVTAPRLPVPQVVPICTSTISLLEDKDSKAMKRQQRMIKNRESASLSRKRKKEYMSTLEERLQETCDENEKLKMENLTLRSRLSQLHSENEYLKKSLSVSPNLKKTIVLVCCLFFTLNLGSWSSIMLTSRPDVGTDSLTVSQVHRGRHLMAATPESSGSDLGYPDTVTDTANRIHDFFMKYGSTGVHAGDKMFNASDVPPMCPTYYNKTESMRLAEQLAGWMYRHEEKKKKKTGKKEAEKEVKQLRPISSLRRAMRGEMGPGLDSKYSAGDARYQIQLYEGSDTGKDFLKALHRRNDTFYVLSFDEDYYLVPAVYHNKTSRPRMSLVMPAVALNESMMPRDDEVGMMQIDCEVMNTNLIHVSKSSIPRYARGKHNHTQTNFNNQPKA
ncbi:cyclic AMP-dependent transcription factor ATF-6 alpha-like isoform X4 [Dreissena polymorpha]|uniref:BZIP domain-containing protein n=1 Tax=Dreissena polymorpha TaxID=45954 RepID=A0A9D4F3A0_DREPO|nr:cyclic AMP-dependent transcription factor ATF-6 alpha-like isoform X4 [Dreissena polymorpha]KAH3791575.1 hypothetical protein DPMN_145064 [Dreissena polymorpha]